MTTSQKQVPAISSTTYGPVSFPITMHKVEASYAVRLPFCVVKKHQLNRPKYQANGSILPTKACSSKVILSKLNNDLSNVEKSILSAPETWTPSDALRLEDYQQKEEQGVILGPYLEYQLAQYNKLKDKDKITSIGLAQNISPTCIPNSLELLKQISHGRPRAHLNQIFINAMSISQDLDIPFRAKRDKLLSCMAKEVSLKYYQLWFYDILRNRGWLYFQALIHIADLVIDLDKLRKSTKLRETNSSEILKIMEEHLAPLYHCRGNELLDYWLPIFNYLQEYPNLSNDLEIVPAHFRRSDRRIKKSQIQQFLNDLDHKGSLSWTRIFAQALGLLD